jgi:hypothetical protein
MPKIVSGGELLGTLETFQNGILENILFSIANFV